MSCVTVKGRVAVPLGAALDLCDKHERKVVDVCGADWDDDPTPPRQRTPGPDGSVSGPGGVAS